MAMNDVIGVVLPFHVLPGDFLGNLVLHYRQTQDNDVGQSDQQAYAECTNAVLEEFTGGVSGDIPPWSNELALVNPEFFGVTKPTIGGQVAITENFPTTTDSNPIGSLRAAMVVTKTTALRGRSYRGRAFVPGMKRAYINMGSWAPTATAFVAGRFEAIRIVNEAGLASPEFVMVVYSATQSAKQEAVVATDVEGFIARTQAGSLRRRSRVDG